MLSKTKSNIYDDAKAAIGEYTTCVNLLVPGVVNTHFDSHIKLLFLDVCKHSFQYLGILAGFPKIGLVDSEPENLTKPDRSRNVFEK